MLHRSWYLGLALAVLGQVTTAAETVPASGPNAVASAAPSAATASGVAPSAATSVLPVSTPAVIASPSDVSQVRIIQSRATTPTVAIYLDIRSETGKAVAHIKAEQLQADIGPYPAVPKSFQEFTQTGEGIATVFLVDVSKSLKPDQFAQIRSALLQWTEKMGDKDRAAIVSFGESVKTVQDFTADKAKLKAKISELALIDVHTRLNEGLIRALDLGRRADADLPRRRVIVTLTDGIDDAAGASTREDTLARIKEEPVPIYAIGFAAPSVSARDIDQGFKLLGSYSHASGGTFSAAGGKPLEQIYAELNTAIHEASLLMVECATCPGDGRAYPLRVRLQADQRVLTASSEVRLTRSIALPIAPASSPASSPQTGDVPLAAALETASGVRLWGLLAGGACFAVIVGYMLLRRKKPGPVLPPAPASEPLQVRTIQGIGDLSAADVANPRSGQPIQLCVVSGAQPGRVWRAVVGAKTVIGRAVSCDVVIDDDSEISATNSALSTEGGLLFVDDLGSTNGTAINGSPIKSRRRINDGDLILVGRTELRLTVLKEM